LPTRKGGEIDYDDIFVGTDRLQLTLLECQLTYTCNIRCAYCFNPHHRRGNELTTAEWKDTIDQASALGATAAIFNGGEPLARRDCVEVIGHAYDAGLQTAISTNGLLLDRETLRDFVRILDVLQISIHPWRYEDDLRGGVREFVDHVRAFKELGGRKAVFNVVLYRGGLISKLDELLEIVAAELGSDLDSIGIAPANPYGHGYLSPSSIPSLEECERAGQIIERFRANWTIRVNDAVSHYFSVKQNNWGSYGVIVNPDGYVYPTIEGADSLAYLFKEVGFDNLREKSLADIWLDSNVLNMFRGTEWHQEPCVSCPVRKECRGGSRLNAYVLTGDMTRADPFCVLSPDHEKVMRFYRDNDLTVIGAHGR